MIMHEDFIIKFYDSTLSTQIEAKDLIDLKEAFHNQVVATDDQTNGRAKNIRKWQGERGDLALTIILKPSQEKELYPQICYIAAVAVGNAIAKLCPGHDIHYKWVNDILLDHRKVSGILLEQYKDNYVLVGIGINIYSKSDDPELRAVGFEDVGLKIGYKDFLNRLLDQFLELYKHWESFGFEKIKNLWLSRAYKLGESIDILVLDQKISGIFSGIDALGNLELKQDDKIIKISAGDVFF